MLKIHPSELEPLPIELYPSTPLALPFNPQTEIPFDPPFTIDAKKIKTICCECERCRTERGSLS